MDKVLLLIMATLGLCAVSSYVGRQYHFVYKLKSMTEALRYCREKYTDLATISNVEEVKMVNNMVDLSKLASSNKATWIGLYDDVEGWRWSLSDKSFYKHGETEFRKWRPTEPNNAYSKEHCVYMLYDGLWYDDRCEVPHKFICMDVQGPNVTFVLINNSMTWTEAQSYCREKHTDLASVRNLTENQKVKEVLPTGQIGWIGLFRDSWKWSDGSNSSFRYWNTGEPHSWAEACAAVEFSNSGKWADLRCDRKEAFICYSPSTAKQVIKLRVQKSSSLDLNDPAVMEQILKQLKQKLKDQGVNQDVKLSWKKQPDGKVFHKEEKKKKEKKKAGAKKDEL